MELDYEIIEKYLLGELSTDELNDFNSRLNTNKEFAKEVTIYKEIQQSLSNKYLHLEKETKLKESLKNIGAKYFEKEENGALNETKHTSIKSYFLKISSIAAIVIISFFLLKPQTNLYDQFSEHSTLEVQVKGDNNKELLQATQLFNNEKYTEAIPLLENYLRSNPEDFEIQMSLGISLLESNKIEDAKLIFEHIYQQNNVFRNKSTWYLALVNVKAEKFEEAKVYLNKISGDSFYSKKAKKLLKKL